MTDKWGGKGRGVHTEDEVRNSVNVGKRSTAAEREGSEAEAGLLCTAAFESVSGSARWGVPALGETKHGDLEEAVLIS